MIRLQLLLFLNFSHQDDLMGHPVLGTIPGKIKSILTILRREDDVDDSTVIMISSMTITMTTSCLHQREKPPQSAKPSLGTAPLRFLESLGANLYSSPSKFSSCLHTYHDHGIPCTSIFSQGHMDSKVKAVLVTTSNLFFKMASAINSNSISNAPDSSLCHTGLVLHPWLRCVALSNLTVASADQSGPCLIESSWTIIPRRCSEFCQFLI